ncbi:hypothetical protein ACQY0O_004434 [Thecaphora frezii]
MRDLFASRHTPCRASALVRRSSPPQKLAGSLWLLLVAGIFATSILSASAQTVVLVSTTTQLASATGSGSLNTPSKTVAEASRTSAPVASQVTSTTIPDFDFSGPQVPYLAQQPLPLESNRKRHKLAKPRMLDSYFTGCQDTEEMVDTGLRFNISAVYAQFDHDLSRTNVLADQFQYLKGVLRITAVGAIDSVAQTANSSLATPPLSTLSVETNFLTFQLFNNNSYLCDHLYPTRPDPENQLIVPAGCLYGPGQIALGVGIPLNDSYTLGTLWTRIRLSDTSSPPKDITCFEVLLSPYDPTKWYWDLILWFPLTLAIGYFVVIAIARISCAVTSRAKAFRHKAREGSQPNVIRDTIAPTLVASLSGQQLASSASLLRFATPGCWDIIIHTQFVAALAMIAVRWPEFAYPFFQRAAWASLVGNTTLIRPQATATEGDPLYTRANLPAGDIGTQMTNSSSTLYMNSSQPNVFLNLDGAKSGIEAFAGVIGLRPKDLFGTCIAVWLVIVASILAVSAAVWLVDSIHDTFLRFQKRRDDGVGLAVQLNGPGGSKEATDFDDEGVARSSLSRRDGYRFLGRSRRRLFGPSNNSVHLKMLHGNLVRAVYLFHLPITIFSTYNMTNSAEFSLTSVSLAAVSFSFLSVLIPAYLVFKVYRTPTAKLYDSIGTLSALGPIYNTYSPGSQLFCAVDFLHTLVLGIVIGVGQSNGTAQAIVILFFEVLFALGASLWLPWGDGAIMGPISFVASVLRIITAVLVLLLCPLIDFGREPVGWLTYVVLLIQGILYVCSGLILLVKIIEGLVRLFGRVPFEERVSARASGLGGSCREVRRRKHTIQLGKPKRRKRKALNRSGSTNTQTLMLANAARPGSQGAPGSQGQMPSSHASSTSKMPMHSRQTSYASYLDGQLQGRKSAANYLNDSNSPYSTYLRGDPHDDGIIMAAMPPHVANVSSAPSWENSAAADRPASPPLAAGFVRTGGGRATDSAPYHTVSGGLASASSRPPSGHGSRYPQEELQRITGANASPSPHDPRGSNQNPAIAERLDERGAPATFSADLRNDLSSTHVAAQYVSGGYPPATETQRSKKRFWKRRSGDDSEESSDDDDDDDDFDEAECGPSKSHGAWRGLSKMSSALGALTLVFSGAQEKTVEQGPVGTLESAADSADNSKGFEVVRPQRPRRSSGAAEQALNSTAQAAASATAAGHPSALHPLKRASSNKDSGTYDPETGTLPPGATQQALLLPHYAPTNRYRQSAQPLRERPEESAGEEAFWIAPDSKQDQTASRPTASNLEADNGPRDISGGSSLHTVSTLGRLAQPMSAEVFDSVDDLPEHTPSASRDRERERRSSWMPTVNFDRPVSSEQPTDRPATNPTSRVPDVETEDRLAASHPSPQFWDSAQAYSTEGKRN